LLWSIPGMTTTRRALCLLSLAGATATVLYLFIPWVPSPREKADEGDVRRKRRRPFPQLTSHSHKERYAGRRRGGILRGRRAHQGSSAHPVSSMISIERQLFPGPGPAPGSRGFPPPTIVSATRVARPPEGG